EAVTSPLVREMLASDLGRRYWLEHGEYAGGRLIKQIEQLCADTACALFGAAYADVMPVSGNVALLAAILTLSQPGDTLAFLDEAIGYVPRPVLDQAGRRVVHLPVDDDDLTVKVDQAIELIRASRPRLVFLGAGLML